MFGFCCDCSDYTVLDADDHCSQCGSDRVTPAENVFYCADCETLTLPDDKDRCSACGSRRIAITGTRPESYPETGVFLPGGFGLVPPLKKSDQQTSDDIENSVKQQDIPAEVSADFYRVLVKHYLVALEGYTVIPSAEIRLESEGGCSITYVVFLGIDFRTRCIETIEVSKSSDPEEMEQLVSKLDFIRRTIIEHLVKTQILSHLSHFRMHWRFFVRRAQVAILRSYSMRRGIDATKLRITALEDVFDALKDRMP